MDGVWHAFKRSGQLYWPVFREGVVAVGGPTRRRPTGDAGALRRARALPEVPADADDVELTRAYWRQARRLHPDRSSDPQATQQFQALHDAYRLILDAAPDAARHPPPRPSNQEATGESTATVRMAGTTQVAHDRSRRGRTRPPQPATPPVSAPGLSGSGDGVWVVAGPVHVRAPLRPDAARTDQEGSP
jgi:hypothetical protein